MSTGDGGVQEAGRLADPPGGGSRWIRTVAMPVEAHGGGTNEYWETLWAEEKVEAPGFLLELLRTELVGRRRILESGCGQGPFVEALQTPDNTVIGVDLAAQALAAAHRRNPSLALGVADVSVLPFADEAFDAVVSLGVVEHFEGGPAAVLREHARVLSMDGILVITVPRRSWLRAVRDTWNLGLRRRASYPNGRRIVTRRQVGTPAETPAETPGAFHQYEFTKGQLLGYLGGAGFQVTSCRAIDAGSALGEAGLSRFAVRSTPAADLGATGTAATITTAPSGRPSLRSRVSKVLLGTEPTGLVGRVARQTFANAIGHVHLVVAVRA